MSNDPANIYESSQSRFNQETERLAGFDLPTRISIEALGAISPGTGVLDVGAGPNTGLGDYIRSRQAQYVALDKNAAFLEKQKLAGAETVLGDIRRLPFEDASFDICHVRFVVSHLGQDKQKAIREVLRVTRPGGRAVFIDYDWTTAHGSPAYDRVKDFMLHAGFLFDADFGAELAEQVRHAATDETAVAVEHSSPARMLDYSQVLKLREAGAADLSLQGKDDAVANWYRVLDELQKESESDNPPGFFFPGMTIVTASK